jgi:hypothetical protein
LHLCNVINIFLIKKKTKIEKIRMQVYFILFYAGFLAFGVNLWHNKKNFNFMQGFF